MRLEPLHERREEAVDEAGAQGWPVGVRIILIVVLAIAAWAVPLLLVYFLR